MKGERKIKEYYRDLIIKIWKEGNKLYKTRLHYPKIVWFHVRKDNVAAEAADWNEIGICFEYAVNFKEEMSAVMIHEVAHSFSTYYCEKIGRTESFHGYLWRRTAKELAKILNCTRPVAFHAYHEMNLTKAMIKKCKPKRRTKKQTVKNEKEKQ